MKEKDEVISRLMEDVQRMKSTLGEVVVGDSAGGGDKATILNNNVGSIRLQEDEGYFNTYAHFGIHHEMLSVG